MKIGVICDCFKMPLIPSIKLAADSSFDGIQIYATDGDFSPERLDIQTKKNIKSLLSQSKLEISALCGDLGGYGFQIKEDNQARTEKTKRIIDLAYEFDTSVVTTHIGVIPDSPDHPRYSVMLDAMCECGYYAAQKGVTLAIETGPEKASVLLDFLKRTEGGVGVNLDPANFVMVTDQDPVEAVRLLGNYIVHTHAKDGIMLKKTSPEIIYDCFATGGIDALNVADYFLETPLGEGSVNFASYLDALRTVGYNGYLTIERETGADPLSDILRAKNTLEGLI